MCGIALAIGSIDADTIAAVVKMRDAQTHRGPDAEGLWRDEHAVLAHRRLSIIDLSDDGIQPMVDPSSGLVITYNGELYNYVELRAELKALGSEFRTRTDTEVVLKAFRHWGRDCVEHFSGMFALGIWDPSRRELFLARDRLGVKPLYYANVDGGRGRRTLLISSEVRGLLASELLERRIDPGALSSYVWNGFVNGASSIIEGVHSLPPGSTATVAADRLSVQPRTYWALPHGESRTDAAPELANALETAVESRLVSDVPLGIFLSGGVDSSAVAALAVRRARGAIRTFSVGFEEAEYDESEHASAVARSLGTEHRHILLTQGRFRDQLEAGLESIDQPTFDQLNTYFISRAVREAGTTVALAGTGGDELFGGYRSFRDLPRSLLAARCAEPLPDAIRRALSEGIARLTSGRPGAVPPQVRWGKLYDVLSTRGDVVKAYQAHYALFTREFHDSLLLSPGDPGVVSGLAQADFARLRRHVGGEHPLHAVSTLELNSFVGNRLLRDCDAASMAVSLELRVPLLDHRVVETAAAMDPKQRFHPLGSKRMLKEIALADLDPSLFERPKSGFVLPIATWLRDELKGEVSAAFADHELCRAAGLQPEVVAALWNSFQRGAPGIYWSRVWSLYVLLWWCRRHRVAV